MAQGDPPAKQWADANGNVEAEMRYDIDTDKLIIELLNASEVDLKSSIIENLAELNTLRTYINNYDPTQTTADWTVGINTPDSNDGLVGRTKTRTVGDDGQYFKIGGLDPDYEPLAWFAFDAADHEVSLYTTTDPKGSISSTPLKRLDIEMGGDSEQVQWTRTGAHVVEAGSSTGALQLIGRPDNNTQDVRREYWDENNPVWETRLDRSRSDRFVLLNETNGTAYEVTTGLTIEFNGNPLTQLREISNPTAGDLGDREWAWDATNSRWLFKDSGGTAHFFNPDGTL